MPTTIQVIKIDQKDLELPIKRFYFTGSIELKCTKCNNTISTDFGYHELEYPTIGETIERGMYCNSCEEEFVLPIKLNSISIEFEYDESKLK